MSTGLIITLVVFLICLSAFFSGSEIVYAAASKPRLHHEADEGSSRAKKALRIVAPRSSTIRSRWRTI